MKKLWHDFFISLYGIMMHISIVGIVEQLVTLTIKPVQEGNYSMKRPQLSRNEKVRENHICSYASTALLGVSLLFGFTSNFSRPELTDYVNPFIGTAPGGGHFGFTQGDRGDVFSRRNISGGYDAVES